MKAFLVLTFFFWTIFLCYSCLDHVPDYQLGYVIDNETKQPLKEILVRDSISGYFIYTDAAGFFNLKGVKSKKIILVSHPNYKPFSLEIGFKKSKNNLQDKTFKLLNITNQSNSFSVINGDSILIELEKKY